MLRELAEQARLHATHLTDDIKNSMSRQEHMRLTRLAIEAQGLATALEVLAASEETTTDGMNQNV